MSDEDTFDPAVLGALVHGLEPATPGASLRERLMAAVSTKGRFMPFLDRMMRIFDLPEARAQAELSTFDAPDDWEAMTQGVQVRDFEAGAACGEAHGGLVRVEPGHAFPRHAHVGEETVLVLQGELEDDAGTRYRAGDTIVSGDGTSHELRVVGETPLLYAALVVGINIEASGDDDDDDDWDDDTDLD
ncbi:MAG: cupin domain-containing protein [Nannocystales bacterium]